MRRAVEITLVVAALVVAPLAVALVGRSGRPAKVAPDALAQARRIVGSVAIGGVRVRLSHCTWSSDGSRISCRATGPDAGVWTFIAPGGGYCRGTSWWLAVGSDHRL